MGKIIAVLVWFVAFAFQSILGHVVVDTALRVWAGFILPFCTEILSSSAWNSSVWRANFMGMIIAVLVWFLAFAFQSILGHVVYNVTSRAWAEFMLPICTQILSKYAWNTSTWRANNLTNEADDHEQYLDILTDEDEPVALGDEADRPQEEQLAVLPNEADNGPDDEQLALADAGYNEPPAHEDQLELPVPDEAIGAARDDEQLPPTTQADDGSQDEQLALTNGEPSAAGPHEEQLALTYEAAGTARHDEQLPLTDEADIGPNDEQLALTNEADARYNEPPMIKINVVVTKRGVALRRTTSDKFALQVSSRDDIQGIISLIMAKKGLQSDRYSLFYCGKRLKELKTLDSLKINTGSVLSLDVGTFGILQVTCK